MIDTVHLDAFFFENPVVLVSGEVWNLAKLTLHNDSGYAQKIQHYTG